MPVAVKRSTKPFCVAPMLQYLLNTRIGDGKRGIECNARYEDHAVGSRSNSSNGRCDPHQGR